MSEPIIRIAQPEDGESILKLMQELGYQINFDDLLANLETYKGSSEVVLVAETNVGVVGFLSFHAIPLFHQRGKLGRITAMCVSSSSRRQGIGKLLLSHLDVVAVELGCQRIEVLSGDHRVEEAHQFYQSCDYKVDIRRFQKILTSST